MLWGLVYAGVIDVSNVAFFNSSSAVLLLAELHARSGAPWVRKFGNLPILEILVIT